MFLIDMLNGIIARFTKVNVWWVARGFVIEVTSNQVPTLTLFMYMDEWIFEMDWRVDQMRKLNNFYSRNSWDMRPVLFQIPPNFWIFTKTNDEYSPGPRDRERRRDRDFDLFLAGDINWVFNLHLDSVQIFSNIWTTFKYFDRTIF